MLAQLYAGHHAEPALEVEVELVSFRGVMTWLILKLILKLILSWCYMFANITQWSLPYVGIGDTGSQKMQGQCGDLDQT